MKPNFNIKKTSTLGSGVAAIAAILASSCCILPIALFNLGIGGAWLSNLAVLQPYRLHFVGIAVILFFVGLLLYVRTPQNEGVSCNPSDGKRRKTMPIILCISATLIALAIIWARVEPLLLRLMQ